PAAWFGHICRDWVWLGVGAPVNALPPQQTQWGAHLEELVQVETPLRRADRRRAAPSTHGTRPHNCSRFRRRLTVPRLCSILDDNLRRARREALYMSEGAVLMHWSDPFAYSAGLVAGTLGDPLSTRGHHDEESALANAATAPAWHYLCTHGP